MGVYTVNPLRILVAIPHEPARVHPWHKHAEGLAARLPRANPGVTFEVALHPTRRTHEAGDGAYSPHARARNSLLDAWLSGRHTHVLWADSDLLDYPADLPTQLLMLNGEGISAPAVTLAAPNERRPRFYDILGFIEDGHGAQMFPPWFQQPGPIVELESVGCCYLAPAGLYRDGARYADTPGKTEHWSVMQAARAAGLRICADTRLRAIHAWLPDFGEKLH
jgi:hypothetical protein